MLRLLQGRRVWMVPLIMAGVVAFVGWWANQRVQSVIEQELTNNLQTTLEANVTALEIWMQNQKRMAAGLAQEPRLAAITVELLAPTTGATNDSARLEVARELLASERLRERTRALGYGVAQLVNTNFMVIAGSMPGRGRWDMPLPQELQPRYADLFASGQPVIITPFKLRPPTLRRPPARGEPGPGSPPEPRSTGDGRRGPGGPREFAVMQVAAPIKDDAGAVRGALALVINPDAEFTRILSVARPGESGETFAFDPEGVLISESRFDDTLKQVGLIEDRPEARSALTLQLRDPGGDLLAGHRPNPGREQPLIAMVARALSGEAGVELTPFRDYRGVPVVGAWRWLPQYDFGVGTKIDASEAYRPLRVVRGVFLILFLLLVLASVLIALFTYMQSVWRRRLTEAELMARQLGQYTLQERIGAGGMGVVYKARHALLRRETAIKLLPPERSDPSDIERFEQEVQLTCRLSHPNTIQVYDYGHTPDGVFYYAMEYLEGLHLGELVARYGPQPESRVIHILRQVCGSLSEAHRLGLIHRDIKPANVFLCDRGGVPDSIKVLDFGLVQHVNDGRRGEGGASAPLHSGRPGPIVGTPNFIAPESLQDPLRSDARSDVYAVGALGYFLLAGHYVFEGDSFEEVSRKHLSETPAPPGARRGEPICPDLETIILRCLQKDPAARPASAHELGTLLAATPCAADWTMDQRVAWWASHRARAHEYPHAGETASTSRDATVNIDLGDRPR